MHLVDLGLDDFGVDHWTEGFVNSDLRLQWPTVSLRTTRAVDVRDEFGERWVTNAGPAAAEPLHIDRRRLLAWVLDRCSIEGLPSLDSWSNRSRWEYLSEG